MEHEEESQLYYKEGRGQIVRPDNGNFSYYDSIYGSWARGTLHGKRIETNLNLEVFPKGYYNNKSIKSISFTQEVRKGIFTGPCSISINGKRVCQTKFADQIELVNVWNHPVGKRNIITTDWAALNCLLNIGFLSFLSLALVP